MSDPFWVGGLAYSVRVLRKNRVCPNRLLLNGLSSSVQFRLATMLQDGEDQAVRRQTSQSRRGGGGDSSDERHRGRSKPRRVGSGLHYTSKRCRRRSGQRTKRTNKPDQQPRASGAAGPPGTACGEYLSLGKRYGTLRDIGSVLPAPLNLQKERLAENLGCAFEENLQQTQNTSSHPGEPAGLMGGPHVSWSGTA